MKNKLKPIMFAGTGSDVGKSIIASAFCRIFLQDGYHPAPFKAQNMSLNSYATAEGLEIGRAQAVQAEAANIPCSSDMNPLLLKPTGEKQTQVVLNGKPIGTQGAYEYFRKEGRSELRSAVNQAFDRLEQQYNPIVMEGAGSISEINLREIDLVNMSMAMHANAAVILVADIDRGGVFASVYGSIMLLNAEERKYVKGILINKFRGDIALFQEGVKLLEDLCKIPVVGVVPYYDDIQIEEEDSVTLRSKQTEATFNKINVAVVLLRHISNFTDFNVLEQDARVHLYYTNNIEEIAKADIILIPGSKNSLSDLYELRRNGVAQSIIRAHKKGASVVGICGGYQIMGEEIADPNSIEGDIQRLPGLGLLPVKTTIGEEKQTNQVKFSFLENSDICEGYEIHMGTSIPTTPDKHQALVRMLDGKTDGSFVNDRCFGTYIHGILDNKVVIDYLLSPYADKTTNTVFDYKVFKEEQYDKLAQHVRNNVDIELVYNILKEEE